MTFLPLAPRRFSLGSACLLGLALAFGALPVPAKAQSETPTQNLFAEPAGLSRPIQLDRVVFMGARNQVVGRHGWALGCLKTHGPLLLSSGRINADPTVYADMFREVMEASNYDVVGDSGALFKDRDADTAEFVIGGLIKNMSVDICDALVGFGQSGKAALDVEWQIYNPILREVVYTTTTSGEAKTKAQPNGGVVAINEAFMQATTGLVNDDGFNALVFTESPSVEAAIANKPSDVTSIPKVAERAGSFQDQITLTRARVATIDNGRGIGSGFFIDEDLLLTNEHVVGGASVVVVKLVTGREMVAEVLATNAARDVALLRTEPLGLGGLPIRTEQPAVGSQVFVIGSPLSEDNESTVSSGIISAYREVEGLRFIQSDANTMGGNSGGPMFDASGNVIGITVRAMFINNVSVGLNLFIPISEALSALNIELADE